ncbi:MAG: MBL fold metallo-hydrolase [Candidatus Lokiarchaeota archaeon]|nr:MBL fold metallo-hydrolase [Candidatus Lokiarchaeota archaeon]
MKIDVLGGRNEIGGNKVLIEHKGTRILMDFGMSFNTTGMYFSEFLQPRKCDGLKDFFEMGLLPDIKGIYREDYVEHMGRPKEDRSVDALFLSHAHADHAQYIHFLRWDIPIYCTHATKLILQALEETGSGGFKDLVTVCETYKHYINKKGEWSRIDRKHGEYVHDRTFHIMDSCSGTNVGKVKIGSLEIECCLVDHSLPGACGFIIYSDEGNLAYSGDIRFHGYHGEYSHAFVEKVKAANPEWLLMEGTRIKDMHSIGELKVREEISKLVSNNQGLVFVEHPIRDLDRVKSIYDSARDNQRQFAVNLKLAYLIELLGDISPFAIDEVKILVPNKGWGLLCKDGCTDHQISKDYFKWEQDFIHRENAITVRDLVENPQHYVVSMNMWEIKHLIDIQPKGAIWIKSSCEPFTDDMELDEERKSNWLNRFGIPEYHAHASGHASGKEIHQIIRDVRPNHVIPIHTEHPELYQK